MGEKLIKTFISIDVGNKIKEKIKRLKSENFRKTDNVNWVNIENIHLTLRYIGPTVNSEIKKINNILENIVKDFREFSLEIKGTGIFPKIQRPRIIWLGINGNLSKLSDLESYINKILSQNGYPSDNFNNFIPHITLGRIRYPQTTTPDLTSFLNASYNPVKFKVQKISLFRTETIGSGPIYSLLGTHYFSNN
ncbi:MAG: RNA 2',3'-cyclic phosphodiesterase [Candidatus Marinimicrobia bacterium]|nr:RNA 2',3'-cyclic phosphodiesterase [Candidatus Neomarinimicrobiota bacterium]|tara:strand:- start:7703 stop:8281 length:579 start_codon:yes stop_codon:yes gene_type:complete